MEQRKYKMPATGEGWRHYKTGLYTVIDLANHQETGEPLVVYTNFGWSLFQLPPLFVRPLAEFIAEIESPRQRIDLPKQYMQRFTFERAVGEDSCCPFIAPARKAQS